MIALHCLLEVLPLVQVDERRAVRANDLPTVIARQGSDIVVVEDYIRVVHNFRDVLAFLFGRVLQEVNQIRT